MVLAIAFALDKRRALAPFKTEGSDWLKTTKDKLNEISQTFPIDDIANLLRPTR